MNNGSSGRRGRFALQRKQRTKCLCSVSPIILSILFYALLYQDKRKNDIPNSDKITGVASEQSQDSLCLYFVHPHLT